MFASCTCEKPNYLEVAKTLLRYGARPDARDVAGKTVCHYGAGSMATKLSLEITSLCMEAYKSCAHFEKKIVLHGLTTREDLNGKPGTCGGFLNGRRVVHLLDLDGSKEKTVLIRPENIRKAGTLKKITRTSDELLLVNLQDRLGNVSLHETVCSENDRADVVEFLLDHGADVDIVDYDGYSPRRWAEKNGQTPGRKCNMALYRALRKEEKKAKAKAKCCAYCKKSGSSKEDGLLRCSRCHVVVYCDAACQKADWKVHKQSCGRGIKLDRPLDGISLDLVFNYGRPDHIGVNEKFWVKVQVSTTLPRNGPHLVYDESRKCQFYIHDDQSGYNELKALVKAEKVTYGEKLYFLASFDDAGDCTIYPHSSNLKKF